MKTSTLKKPKHKPHQFIGARKWDPNERKRKANIHFQASAHSPSHSYKLDCQNGMETPSPVSTDLFSTTAAVFLNEDQLNRFWQKMDLYERARVISAWLAGTV